MRWIELGILAGALTMAVTGPARADVAYSQTFDTGSAAFTVNDPFWLDNALANGYIIKTTNSAAVFGDEFGGSIPQDVSGTGYFLFDGTYYYNGNSSTIPAGHDEYFISPTFTVVPNTVYNVSFYLTSANGINSPSVTPEIDGSLLGSPVSPVGDYLSSGWQQFSYTWNSGTNSSASLILHDGATTVVGNDFATDDILVSSAVATPEPAAVFWPLAAFCVLTGLAARRRKSTCAPETNTAGC